MKRIVLIVGVVLLTVILMGCETDEITPDEVVQIEETDVDAPQEEETIVEVTETTLNRVKVMVDVLNLRTAPTVSSEKIGEVYFQSVYEVIESETVNDEIWYKINAGDYQGWIASWFCEETFLEAYEVIKMNEDGLVLENYYEVGSSIIFKEHIQSQSPYDIYINDQLIEETYSFISEGEYEYYTVLYDELGRGVNTRKSQLRVVENKDYLCYESPDRTSEVTYNITDETEFNNIYGIIYDYGETLDIWYELYPPNEEICYFLRTDDLDIRRGFDHVVFKINDEVHEQSGEYFSQNHDFDDRGYIIFEDKTLFMMNIKSGKVIEISQPYQFIDNEFLFVYKDINNYINDTNKDYFNIEIYNMKDENFELVYEGEVDYVGIDNQGFGNNVLTFSGFDISQNDWDFAPENLLKETVQLQEIDNTWHRQIVSSDHDYTNPSSLITVYSSLKQGSEVINVFDVHDVESIIFLKTYDIIDSQLVLWFQVTLEDGTIGYTYRPRLPHEQGYLLNSQDFYIMTADGSKRRMTAASNFWYVQTHMRDELAMFNMYLTSESYEGTTLKAYDREANIEVKLPFNNTVLLSPDKTKLLGTLGYYAEPESSVMIFEYRDNEFQELYRLDLSQTYSYNYEWLTDDSLSFILGDKDEKYDAVLELINNEWILTTECPNL